jgi:hypothetical protein
MAVTGEPHRLPGGRGVVHERTLQCDGSIAAVPYGALRFTGRIPAGVLLFGGVFYAVFVTYVVPRLA